MCRMSRGCGRGDVGGRPGSVLAYAKTGAIIRRAMTLGFRTSSRFRFALRLAFFAVFTQLALGLASAGHQARMLGAAPDDWVEICTVYGLQSIRAGEGAGVPDDGQDVPNLNASMQCALCAVAAISAPPRAAVSFSVAVELAVGRPVLSATAAPSSSFFGGLPPSRAPPVLS